MVFPSAIVLQCYRHFAPHCPSTIVYGPSTLVPQLDSSAMAPALWPQRYGPLVLVLRSLQLVPSAIVTLLWCFPHCPSTIVPLLWSQHCGPSTLITPLWPQHYGPSAIWFHHYNLLKSLQLVPPAIGTLLWYFPHCPSTGPSRYGPSTVVPQL